MFLFLALRDLSPALPYSGREKRRAHRLIDSTDVCVSVGAPARHAHAQNTHTYHTTNSAQHAHTHTQTHAHTCARTEYTDTEILMAWVTCQCRVPPMVVRYSVDTNTMQYSILQYSGYWILGTTFLCTQRLRYCSVLGTEYYFTGHIEVEVLQHSRALEILQYSGTLEILQYSGYWVVNTTLAAT